MTHNRLCAQCGERPAARNRTRCWRCIKPYQPRERTDQHAPGWDKVPIGTRFTLTEIAAITGLKRTSVARYAQPSVQGKRKLPDGFKVLRPEPRMLFILREK